MPPSELSSDEIVDMVTSPRVAPVLLAMMNRGIRLGDALEIASGLEALGIGLRAIGRAVST